MKQGKRQATCTRRLRIAWLGILVVGLAGVPLRARAQQKTPTLEQWREDLRFLSRELVRRHADVFHDVTPETFNRVVVSLDERLSSLTPHQVVMEMARLVALVGDAHTYVAFPETGPLAFRRFPLRFTLFEDEMVVTAASPRYTRAIGWRLRTIDGTSVDEAWERIELFVSRDNESTLRFLVPARMAIPELLHGAGLIERPHLAQFEFLDGSGTPKTLELAVQAASEQVDAIGSGDSTEGAPYWRDPDNPYWFTRLRDDRTLYLQFNSVRNKPNESLAAFAARVEKEVSEPSIGRLIIDLRRNVGGSSELAVPLVKAIIRSGKFDQPGGLFVVVGPATISAATVFAVELSRYAAVTYVGEPSGSRPNQFGEIVFFELPHSKVRVGYAAAFFQTAGYKNHDPWIRPDIAVRMSWSDFLNRRDPVLDEIARFVPPEPLEDILARLARNKGLDTALQHYRSYRSDPRHAYSDTERSLRRFADRLLEAKDVDGSLRVHRLNVEVHEDRARAWYGLGDALRRSGQDDASRAAFARAVSAVREDPSLYPALRIVVDEAIRERLRSP